VGAVLVAGEDRAEDPGDDGILERDLCPGRRSQLSAWWIRLGITPELIEPAHSEQNGRHERMHKTLKREATRLPQPRSARGSGASPRSPTSYTERPREALDQQPPRPCTHRRSVLIRAAGRQLEWTTPTAEVETKT